MSKMIRIFCLMSFASFLHAFLLDTDTPATSGGLMTDNHYDYLLKLFMDERNARLQLQKYVIKQQEEITALSGLKTRMEKLENSTVIATLIATTSDVHNKYLQLEEKYNSLQKDQIKLSDELHAFRNRTLELEQELVDLKQVKAINQLQALNNVQQQLQSVQQEVNSLKSNSQARGQDIVAMYNDVTANKRQLSTLEVQQQSQLANISILEKNQNIITTRTKSLNHNQSVILNELSSLGNRHDAFVANITKDTKTLESKYETLESDIQKTNQQMATNEEYVGFTAFGSGAGMKSKGEVLKFPNIKSSYGMSNLATLKNNGIFTCERSGMYLIIITVMSGSQRRNAGFYIYKGNTQLSLYYIGESSTSATAYNSGTGTILIPLNSNDTVYVKTSDPDMVVYDGYSSFSAVKLR